MERDLRREVGGHVTHVLHHLVVDAVGVGHETTELLVREEVSDHADRELGLLVQDVGRFHLLGRLLDLIPQRDQALQVLGDLLLGGALRGRPDDHAVLLRLHLVQDRLQPLAGIVREPAGDPRDVLVGREDEEPARERDLRRESGALAPHRILRDLHHDRLPGLQHPLDARRPAALEVLGCVVDLARVQDAVAPPADVDEGGLHPGEHVLDATQIDVAHHRVRPAAGDVVLHEGVLLEHGDLVPFTVLGDDHQLVGDPWRRDLRLALAAAAPASERARTQPARGSTGRHLLLERLRPARSLGSVGSVLPFLTRRGLGALPRARPLPAASAAASSLPRRPRPIRGLVCRRVADAAARSSGWASSRWLPGVCSGSFTAAPLRLRPPRVPWRRGCPSSAPSVVRSSAWGLGVRPGLVACGSGGTAPTPSAAPATASAPPSRRLLVIRPACLRGRTVVIRLRRRRLSPRGRLVGLHPARRGPIGPRSIRGRIGIRPFPRLSRLFRYPLGRLGGRLARRVGRTLEDRGEAVRGRRFARRRLGLSIHGYSLRSERGGGPDTARRVVDARSSAMNAPSPARRRSPRAGLKTCSYNCRSCPGPRRLPGGPLSVLGAAGGVARHLTRFFPHHERRISAAGPGGARLCIEDSSPRKVRLVADPRPPPPGSPMLVVS